MRTRVELWDLRTGQECRTLPGHDDYLCGVTLSPDGKRLASVGGDAALKVWEVATGRLLATMLPLPAEVGSSEEWVAFIPEGNYVCSEAGRFVRWRVGEALVEAGGSGDGAEGPEAATHRWRMS